MKFWCCASLLLGSWLLLPRPKTPAVAAQPQPAQLYQTHCAACHGPQGEGGVGPTLVVPKLTRATTDEALFKVIKEGVAGTEMPGSRLENDQLRQLVQWVRKLGQTPLEQVSGNVARGEKLYFAKGDCAACHAIKGRGSAFGPDLSEIGLRRGATHLRTSLLAPEADVPKSFLVYRPGTSILENFLQVRVVTNEGQRLTAVRVNEDTFTIQLRDVSGRVYSFFKSDLKELHKDWGKSPMPSYRGLFTKDELDDVVAFLVSLRGEK